ncbi:MAG: tetratricopeptide repeat protein [Chthoniobacterales bacterium]
MAGRRPHWLWWSIAALCLVVLVTAPAAGLYLISQSLAGARLAEEGRQALARREHEKAIASLDAALGKPLQKRLKAAAYLWRGAAKSGKGRFDEAIADLTVACRINPELAEAYGERALAYQQKGDKEKALQDFEEAIRHGARGWAAFWGRGAILFERGEVARAAADFTEAIHAEPNHPVAYIQRGHAYAALNELDAAIASFESALRIDPENQEARAARGDLYYRKGEVAKTLDDYAHLRTSKGEEWAARTAQPPPSAAKTDTAVLLLRANAEAQSGRIDQAIDIYNQLLLMNLSLPDASTACQNRGNAYRQKGDDERALRDYDQAIRFNPANAGAYVNRGVIYGHRGDDEAAIMDYTEAIRLDPKMHQAFHNRALAYRDQDKLDLAERDLTEAIRLDANFASAYVNRGAVHLAKGNLDRALADYEAALRVDPAVAEAYMGRADVLSRKLAYSRAAADWEKALSLRPARAERALNAFAWFRATCPAPAVRNGKQAIEAALQACELTDWMHGGYVDTLAAAYAENGEFEKAIEFQQYALRSEGMGPADRPGAEKRLSLYGQRRPYREEKPE